MADPRTGKQQINENLIAGTAGVSAFAQGIAFGMGPKDAAVGAAKEAALQRLLGPTAVFAGALTGVLRTMKQIVDQSGILERGMQRISSMQQMEGKFQTMLKSISLAKERMAELYKFAASSPFDVQSVMRANLALQALTRGSMATARGMKLVGDVAAATGEEIDSVAVKFGKLYNGLRSGRSLDKVLFQLQSIGAISDELADQLEDLGTAGASFQDKWSAVEKAFEHTRGGMANEMEGLAALQTKLENVSGAMEQAFGEPFVEAQAKSIKATIAATENLTPLIRQIGSDMAPFLTFTRSLKDELVIDTLATKGMASAMMGLWSAMKTGLGAAAVGTIATGLANILPAIGQVRRHSRLRRDAYTAAGRLGQGQGLMDEGLTSWGRAKSSWKDHAFVDAAGFALEAAALRTSGYLWKNHEAAVATAKASTGKFSIASYAAAFAINTIGAGVEKVLPLVKKFASGVAGSVGQLFSLKSVTGWAAWAGAAAVAGYAWVEALDAIEKKYATLSDEITATTVKIRDQLAAVRDLDQWRDAVGKTTEDLQSLRDKRLALLKEGNITGPMGGFFGRIWDKVSGEESARGEAVNVLTNQIALAEARMRKARERAGAMGWSNEEREYFRGTLRNDAAMEDAAFSSNLNSADDAARVKLLAARQQQLLRRADQGDAVAKGRMSFERTEEGRRAGDLDDARANAEAEAREKRLYALDKISKLDIPGFSIAGISADAEGFKKLEERLDSLIAEAATYEGSAGKALGKSPKELAQIALRRENSEKALGILRGGNLQIAGLDSEAAKAKAAAEDLRINQTQSELISVSAKIAKLTSGSGPLSDVDQAKLNTLQTRKEELLFLQESAASNRANAAQLGQSLPEAQLAAARRARAIDIAREEADAAKEGRLTGALSMENRRGELIDQIAELKNLPERAQERQDLQNQLAQLDAERTQYRIGKAVDRYRTGLDALGARGIEDAMTLRGMQDEYQANGLSPNQARYDLTAGWLAEARNQRPTIIADSMQSIGGGGGFASTEPLMQVQKRIEELLNRSVELQQLIARNTRDSGRIE